MAERGRIRVGLVGAGEWARFGHVPALRSLPEYELVAVATTRRETAKSAASRFATPRACVGFEALVEAGDVDLVVVNKRAPEHAPVVETAIAAGKHVYCEWPLTTTTARSAGLLDAADRAGVRHAVGLQRRMGAGGRFLRRLLDEDYVGRVRSASLVVTEPSFSARRPRVLGFTIPAENFSHVASIYGGHFLDLLLEAVGEPRDFSAVLANQFAEVVIEETGESIPTTAPDVMLLAGTLAGGAVLSVRVEAGKRNGFGVRLDVTGTEGDLRLTYAEAFGDRDDAVVEGSRGSRQPLAELPIPDDLRWARGSNLRGSVGELADLYAAFARDLAEGTSHAPTFADALRMHRLLDAIGEAASSGKRVPWEPLGGR